jgi:hypothetical protein
MRRSRKSRSEVSLGPHAPEPILSREDCLDCEREALLADSVGLALLVVHETLAPAERLAFVLHHTFDSPFDEIAPSWSTPQPEQSSSRAAHAAGCKERAVGSPSSVRDYRLRCRASLCGDGFFEEFAGKLLYLAMHSGAVHAMFVVTNQSIQSEAFIPAGVHKPPNVACPTFPGNTVNVAVQIRFE